MLGLQKSFSASPFFWTSFHDGHKLLIIPKLNLSIIPGVELWTLRILNVDFCVRTILANIQMMMYMSATPSNTTFIITLTQEGRGWRDKLFFQSQLLSEQNFSTSHNLKLFLHLQDVTTSLFSLSSFLEEKKNQVAFLLKSIFVLLSI